MKTKTLKREAENKAMNDMSIWASENELKSQPLLQRIKSVIKIILG